MIGGCAVFPPDNPWNTDISGEAVDPGSDALIASIGLDTGLCDSDPAAMEFKKALIRISQRAVALVDSSKWEAVSLTAFADFNQISALVTDRGIDRRHVLELKKRGVEVILAS